MSSANDGGLKEGFAPCLSRICPTCGGTGEVSARPYTAVSGRTTPAVKRCRYCINGFQFKNIDAAFFVDWVWQKLFEHIESSPKISAEFLDLIARATENKMAPPVPAWSSICTCYHAPEEHGANGCAAYNARGEECRCIAARGALPREGS